MGAAGKPPPKDTTDSLFDALQAAKEKKHSHAPLPGVSVTVEPPPRAPIGKPLIMIAAVVVAVSGLIWALTRPRAEAPPVIENDSAPPRPITPQPNRAFAPPPTVVSRPAILPSADARRQQQVEAEREQRVQREQAEREAMERERLEREREMEREASPLQNNDSPPQRAGDWRAQQPEGYVEDRPAEDRPGEEGVVSRAARERGSRVESGDEPGTLPNRDADSTLER